MFPERTRTILSLLFRKLFFDPPRLGKEITENVLVAEELDFSKKVLKKKKTTKY